MRKIHITCDRCGKNIATTEVLSIGTHDLCWECNEAHYRYLEEIRETQKEFKERFLTGHDAANELKEERRQRRERREGRG